MSWKGLLPRTYEVLTELQPKLQDSTNKEFWTVFGNLRDVPHDISLDLSTLPGLFCTL